MVKQFQIKQKLWSLGGKFTITDQAGLPAYQVEGSFFQIPKTFTIRDMSGRVISQIEKHLISFLPKFDIRLSDGSFFTLKKEFTFFKPRYKIENLNLSVQGDFWDMNFELFQNGQQVARISQEWFKLASTYQIEVYQEAYADLVVSLVIAIDYVKEMEASSSSSST